VLVHDDVEGVELEHERQVVQLHDPDAVLREALGDVLDEGGRVLEVVEHRDARDDLRAAVRVARAQRPGAEEVADDVVALLDRVAGDVRGVEAEEAQLPRGVAVQQRAVVAADVDHEVAGRQLRERLRRLGDAVEVVRHRPVDAAAVPVGLVEDRARDGVADLDEAARVLVARHVAAHELERDRALHGLAAARLGERPREGLLAEVEHRRQLPGATDPARRPRAQAGGREVHSGGCAAARATEGARL
jgi:hypothetical protein